MQNLPEDTNNEKLIDDRDAEFIKNLKNYEKDC